jgi:hypothetical protein
MGPRLRLLFGNKFIFYDEGLLAQRPNPKLEDHPLSFASSRLFNIFTATLHSHRLEANDNTASKYRDVLKIMHYGQ